jgi:dimeric dUTPase (all-alpha-NTP-PPase superfamily)
MGITYFALGMLSMVALVFVGVIVWGLVKVLRIERQIVAIKENQRFDVDNVQRQFENVYRSIGELRDDSNKSMDNLWREVTIKFDESIRYTDKRIDKSLNQKEIL